MACTHSEVPVQTNTVIPLVPHGQQPNQAPMSSHPIPENGKKFFIWTMGCQMNEADSQKVAAMLQEVGYRKAQDENDADIVILNSCVVRQAAEDKVAGRLDYLGRLKREKPHMPLVLTGCMVTRQQEKLKKRFPHVDLFFNPSDFHKLVEVVPELELLEDDMASLPHYYQPQLSGNKVGVSAYVPIIYGCNFVCSYCIVPYRRGKETSRPFNDIVTEVERLVNGGVREVTLLGQTVNAYGYDLEEKSSLSKLLAAVDKIPGLDRLRFLTSHPKYMGDDVLDAIAELPSACEHMNLPVQAGDEVDILLLGAFARHALELAPGLVLGGAHEVEEAGPVAAHVAFGALPVERIQAQQGVVVGPLGERLHVPGGLFESHR